MGVADFYLTIKFSNLKHDDFELIVKSIVVDSLFRIIDNNQLDYLSVECKFDSLIPSIIVIFNALLPYKNIVDFIETYGVSKNNMFESVEDFLTFVFSKNKEKLLSYYTQMGYFVIDSTKYYERRNNLRKYYKKMSNLENLESI